MKGNIKDKDWKRKIQNKKNKQGKITKEYPFILKKEGKAQHSKR